VQRDAGGRAAGHNLRGLSAGQGDAAKQGERVVAEDEHPGGPRCSNVAIGDTDRGMLTRPRYRDRSPGLGLSLLLHRPAFHASTHLIGALSFTLTLPSCRTASPTLAQTDPIETNDAPPEAIEPSRALAHLAHLAHLPQGEWRANPANGTQQRDVWTWGPSRHALTSITSNSQATSQAIFGSFRVIYHHPQRDELAVLVLSAPSLIQTGTLTPLEGLDLRFDMTLFYDLEQISWATEPTRKISSVWTFDTPTSYTNHWIEDQGQPVDPSVTAWAYTRHDNLTPLPPSAGEPPEPIKHLNALLPFLQSEWTTDTTRTTFAWIPYNEAIFMRTTDNRTNNPITEAIFYPHPHTKTIHTLTIHDSGAIDEGTANTEGGAIIIHANRADATTTTRIEQRIERPSAETIRIHTRSINGTERASLDETTHQAALKSLK
jgi:hypothetical protein